MRKLAVMIGAGFVLARGGVASADLHTWNINEVYSNASGTIQFIELREVSGLNGQHRLATSLAFPHTFDTGTSLPFTYPNDLPSTATANRFFLMATAGFGSLPGGVTPDYVIPNNFFSVTGDSLTFSNIHTVTFTNGQLPTDGELSLKIASGNVLSTGVNSPTNFAGTEGSVPEPATLAVGAVFTTLFLRRRPARPLT